MKESEKADQTPHQEQAQSSVPPPPAEAEQKEGCKLNSLCDAVEKGARHARQAAEETVPKVKAAAADAAYWLGYGLTYAVVFSAVAIKEFAPAALVSGCRDGAKAGKTSAEKLATDRAKRREATTAPSPSAAGGDPQVETIMA